MNKEYWFSILAVILMYIFFFSFFLSLLSATQYYFLASPATVRLLVENHDHILLHTPPPYLSPLSTTKELTESINICSNHHQSPSSDKSTEYTPFHIDLTEPNTHLRNTAVFTTTLYISQLREKEDKSTLTYYTLNLPQGSTSLSSQMYCIESNAIYHLTTQLPTSSSAPLAASTTSPIQLCQGRYTLANSGLADSKQQQEIYMKISTTAGKTTVCEEMTQQHYVKQPQQRRRMTKHHHHNVGKDVALDATVVDCTDQPTSQPTAMPTAQVNGTSGSGSKATALTSTTTFISSVTAGGGSVAATAAGTTYYAARTARLFVQVPSAPSALAQQI